MRFSVCLRLIRSMGFFWGNLFVPYSYPLGGWRGAPGYRFFWKKLVFTLAEGNFIGANKFVLTRSYTRLRSLAKVLFFLAPPHIPINYPWAWFILRQLKLRTYRSLRYRLGLPANGQRTHTNAQTTARHLDLASSTLKKLYWRRRLWQVRSVVTSLKQRQSKPTRAKQKLTKKKGPVARSKDKKKSVWR